MQASLNELAEILAEREGRQFDVAFKEQMKVVVNYWRARLVVDSLNSRPQDRKFFTVWIDMPLEVVNLSEFPDFPDCPVLRTTCELPRPIRANSKLYDFIGQLNRQNVIPVKEPYQIKPLMESKYTGSEPKAALINNRIYVFGRLDMPGISVQLIPEDIDDYNKCCEECGSPCLTGDEPYPVSADIKQRIIQAALSTELGKQPKPETKIGEIPVSNDGSGI